MNSSSNGFFKMFVRTFNRPRCGMPITNSNTPSFAPAWMMASIIGISVSPPSRPKRFLPRNFTCKKFSNCSARRSKYSVRSRVIGWRFGWLWFGSRCSASHLRAAKSWTCMYSTPTDWQYVCRSASSSAPSVWAPAMLKNIDASTCLVRSSPDKENRSRASSHGVAGGSVLSGLVRAIRCPDIRKALMSRTAAVCNRVSTASAVKGAIGAAWYPLLWPLVPKSTVPLPKNSAPEKR